MNKAVTAVLGCLLLGAGCLVASVSGGDPVIALSGLCFSVVAALCFTHLGSLA